MPGRTLTTSAGAQAGSVPATAVISTNGRVRTARGPVALLTDTLVFPGGQGRWTMGDQRVRIQGVPTVSESAVGTATLGSSTVPVRVALPDARLRTT